MYHVLLTFIVLSLLSFGMAAPPPNIVVIYTDDQGYGDASCLNPEAKFSTPNLDRLAREGMTFRDAHSSDGVCTPSRYGLLTGRYSWRTHLKSGVMGAEGSCLIEEGRVTVASLLQANGYQTAMVGKWHLGMVFDGKKGDRDWSKPFQEGPFHRGFGYFYGIPASMNYGVLTYLENDRVLQPATLWTAKKPGRVVHDRASYRIMPPYAKRPTAKLGLEVADDFLDETALKVFTEKGIKWMEGAVKRDKPFFLYLPLTSPHKPVCAMPEFVGKSDCGAYGDFMVETDFRVGQILECLERLGVDDNTLLFFSSDNGAEKTYAERVKVYGHRSSLHFRGGKRDLYEGGHRVPTFIRWPAQVKAGSVTDRLVCQTDLLATVADIVGAKLPATAGEDSESFFPTLQGKAQMARSAVVHHSASGHFAVREGDWKLIMRAQGPAELYNLAKDISERANRFKQDPEQVKDLTRRLSEIVEQGRSTEGAPQANDVKYWKQLTWIDAPKPATRRRKSD